MVVFIDLVVVWLYVGNCLFVQVLIQCIIIIGVVGICGLWIYVQFFVFIVVVNDVCCDVVLNLMFVYVYGFVEDIDISYVLYVSLVVQMVWVFDVYFVLGVYWFMLMIIV